jgi:hypothetical protein
LTTLGALVVVVEGNHSLDPIIPRRGVPPLAFTNPIWLVHQPTVPPSAPALPPPAPEPVPTAGVAAPLDAAASAASVEGAAVDAATAVPPGPQPTSP